jgi:hypothetical protein
MKTTEKNAGGMARMDGNDIARALDALNEVKEYFERVTDDEGYCEYIGLPAGIEQRFGRAVRVLRAHFERKGPAA